MMKTQKYISNCVWLLAGSVFTFLLFSFAPMITQATPFGTGRYGNCGYDSCTVTATQTTETLPSGLQVSINIVEGQIIPYNGYLVRLTPLNGQGSSFKQALIYLDGVQIYTVVPDATGTAQWFWDPQKVSGTKLTIVVMDINNQATTYTFQVSIGARPTAAPVSPQPKTDTSSSSPIVAAVQKVQEVAGQIYEGAKEAIKTLPKPVVYSFPYFLFGLLGLNVLLLLFQTRRELKEHRTLQALIARARAVSEAKKTFTELVSHYLRTPLTVILGGIDLLTSTGTVSSSAIDLKTTAQRLRDKIETLIQDTTNARAMGAVSNGAVTVPTLPSPWRQPALLAPLVLIAVLVVPFNYLAANVDTFSITQVNLLAQAAIFTALVLGSYQVVRHLQLRRRDTQTLQQVLREEAATSQVRDQLIARAVTALNDDITSLDMLVRRAGQSQATTFINRGQKDFHDVLTKFAIAGKLQNTYSTAPFTQARLDDLIQQATRNLQQQLQERRITVQQTFKSGFTFQTQNPELLVFVLGNLLDNALAYSPEGGMIEIGAMDEHSNTVITVKDHGAGIPEDKFSLLFQPFSKIESVETFTHQGIGFSLYLDKLILTYLGGHIALQSSVGKGTIVTLTLPKVLR